jgi:large subunit ribosomal protein L22e
MPKAKKQQTTTKKFTLDCTAPFNDKVLDPASFQKFLQDKIKVDGRTGNLAGRVTVARAGDSPLITVTAQLPFSKRYLKYLTKKYLKQQDLRDYLHVIATNAATYELKYFNISDAGGADAEDDDE